MWFSGLIIYLYSICYCGNTITFLSFEENIFTDRPLGRFSLRVAMAVYVFVFLQSYQCNFLFERDGDFQSKRIFLKFPSGHIIIFCGFRKGTKNVFYGKGRKQESFFFQLGEQPGICASGEPRKVFLCVRDSFRKDLFVVGEI